jgi:hypothetical protein
MKAKHAALDARYFDEAEGRRQQKHPRIKFRPRRGKAKITWPLAPKKALILLTGRHTLARAKVAYVFWVRTYHARWRIPVPSAKSICDEALKFPWTKEDFRKFAKGYCDFPRQGFNTAKQKERISKVLRELGLE